MFEEFFRRVVEEERRRVEEAKAKSREELDALMVDIEQFHKDQAVDKALANHDKQLFFSLMKGEGHVHQ